MISLSNFAVSIGILIVFFIIFLLSVIVRRGRKYAVKLGVLFAIIFVYTMIGAVAITRATTYFQPVCDATVTATVNSDSYTDGVINGNGLVEYSLILTDGEYFASDSSGDLGGKISARVKLPADINIKVGDKIIFHADIYAKQVKLLRSVSVYNYFNGGVRYTLDNVSIEEVKICKPSVRESIKLRARDAMTKYVPSGGILFSMIFGDKTVMDEQFVKASRLTGIAHLFAVSGLHLGLVAGIIGWICKKLHAGKIVDFIVVVIFAAMYAYLVGFGASVSRALLMLIVYKVGKLLGMRHCGISSLSVSVLFLLLINPLTLFDLSFQLSVMAIVGVLFFERPLGRIIKTPWKHFNSFVCVNLSVNIAILPISLFYFGRVSLIFLLANLLVVPLAVLVFPFIFVFVLASVVFPQLAYALLPIGYLFALLEKLITLIAAIPFLSIKLRLNTIMLMAYIGIMSLISAYSMLGAKFKKIVALSMCAVCICVAALTSFGRIDGSIKLETIVSTKYNDIVMLDIKNKHYMFVTGSLSIYSMWECKNYLQENNIDKLDGIVKASFTPKEADVLGEYMSELDAVSVITSASSDYLADMYHGKVKFAENIGSFMIVPLNENMVELRSNDVTILFVDNRYGEVTGVPNADIVYCLGDSSAVEANYPKYLVSDMAVLNNIAQSVNSYFTFIIKNAKIKVV